jgi:ribulose kinase
LFSAITIQENGTNLASKYAPLSHTTVTGTDTVLGHLKLSDATNSTSGVAGGIAATPLAVKTVMDAVNGLIAANDAMVFKGTIGTGGTVTTLPTNGYQAG